MAAFIVNFMLIGTVLIVIFCGIFVGKYNITCLNGKKRLKKCSKICEEIFDMVDFRLALPYSAREIVRFCEKSSFLIEDTQRELRLAVIKSYKAYIEKYGIESFFESDDCEAVMKCISSIKYASFHEERYGFFETVLSGIVKENYDVPLSVCTQFKEIRDTWISEKLKWFNRYSFPTKNIEENVDMWENEFDAIVRKALIEVGFEEDKEAISELINKNFPFIF